MYLVASAAPRSPTYIPTLLYGTCNNTGSRLLARTSENGVEDLGVESVLASCIGLGSSALVVENLIKRKNGENVVVKSRDKKANYYPHSCLPTRRKK